jgi:hypothetical protein
MEDVTAYLSFAAVVVEAMPAQIGTCHDFLILLWKLADFHAYAGYEFTHKQGIEANFERITGVSFTHKRGTKTP